jgi:hypothetical protein
MSARSRETWRLGLTLAGWLSLCPGVVEARWAQSCFPAGYGWGRRRARAQILRRHRFEGVALAGSAGPAARVVDPCTGEVLTIRVSDEAAA